MLGSEPRSLTNCRPDREAVSKPSSVPSQPTACHQPTTTLQSSPRERRRGFALLLLGTLLPLYHIVFDSGWILDDELAHYWFSHSAWKYPDLLLDMWARPGRNLIHFPVAWAGLTTARVYTLALTCVAVALTWAVGRTLHLEDAWLLPFLLWFQPWTVELSFPILTQAPMMLVWIAAVHCHLRDRTALAAILFGYLPLIRHEAIAITAAYGLICLHSRNWRGAAFSALPIVVFNATAFALVGRIPFAVYLDSNPTDLYGSGPIWHFVGPTFLRCGIATSLLCLIGSRRFATLHRNCPVLLTFPLYFVLHSIIFWQGLFASAGYVHFLMPMAPYFALGALCGVNALPDIGQRIANDICAQTRRTLLGGRLVSKFAIPILFGALVVQSYMQPYRFLLQGIEGRGHYAEARDIAAKLVTGFLFDKTDLQLAVGRADAWIRQQPDLEHREVICHHIMYQVQHDQVMSPRQVGLLWGAPDKIDPDLVYLWEPKYAPSAGRTLDVLQDLSWQTIYEDSESGVRILAYGSP